MCEGLRVIKVTEKKREWWPPQDGGWSRGNYCLMGTEFLLEMMKKFLARSDGDGCTMMTMYLMPLSFVFLRGNFYVLYMLPQHFFFKLGEAEKEVRSWILVMTQTH